MLRCSKAKFGGCFQRQVWGTVLLKGYKMELLFFPVRTTLSRVNDDPHKLVPRSFWSLNPLTHSLVDPCLQGGGFLKFMEQRAFAFWLDPALINHWLLTLQRERPHTAESDWFLSGGRTQIGRRQTGTETMTIQYGVRGTRRKGWWIPSPHYKGDISWRVSGQSWAHNGEMWAECHSVWRVRKWQWTNQTQGAGWSDRQIRGHRRKFPTAAQRLGPGSVCSPLIWGSPSHEIYIDFRFAWEEVQIHLEDGH